MDVFDVLASERFRLSVCPHDTAKNTYGWAFLNTYLQRHLACRLQFEPQDSFLFEREEVLRGGVQLVYANPYSAVVFAREAGFVPVAKPVGIHDETYLVVRADAPAPAVGVRPVIASATDKLIVHALGLSLLPEIGVLETGVDFLFTQNHLSAAKAVIDGAAQFGFVFNETWDGMSDFTRAQLRIVQRTAQSLAFHCFMAGGALADRAGEIGDVLCGLSSDPTGADILAELHLPHGFEPVLPARLVALAGLLAA